MLSSFNKQDIWTVRKFSAAEKEKIASARTSFAEYDFGEYEVIGNGAWDVNGNKVTLPVNVVHKDNGAGLGNWQTFSVEVNADGNCFNNHVD